MKKFVVAAMAVFAFAVTANAADMPTKARAYVRAPAFNWTGFYVGGTVGLGWGSSQQSATSPGLFGETDRYHLSGIVGGGTIGYNWQITPNWLAGLEGDFSGAHINGTGSSSVSFGCLTVCTTNVNSFGTARARVGYALGNVLFYGTGGYAFGKVYTDVLPASVFFVSQTNERSGWTAGLGLEYAFDRNWSAKIEYLYVDFGKFVWTNASLCSIQSCMVDARFSVARIGVNYRFGGI
jgi:outer membrane immunogenic protein